VGRKWRRSSGVVKASKGGACCTADRMAGGGALSGGRGDCRKAGFLVMNGLWWVVRKREQKKSRVSPKGTTRGSRVMF